VRPPSGKTACQLWPRAAAPVIESTEIPLLLIEAAGQSSCYNLHILIRSCLKALQ